MPIDPILLNTPKTDESNVDLASTPSQPPVIDEKPPLAIKKIVDPVLPLESISELVPAGDGEGGKIICIAIEDVSASAEGLVEYIQQNVSQFSPEQDKLVLVNVYEGPLVSSSVFRWMLDGVTHLDYGDTHGDIDLIRREESERVLNHFATKLHEFGFEKLSTYSVRGDLSEELCYICQQLKANLLILGSKGLEATWPLNYLSYTLGDYCKKYAGCEVLVVSDLNPTNAEVSSSIPEGGVAVVDVQSTEE